jgi:hypothetical protein
VIGWILLSIIVAAVGQGLLKFALLTGMLVLRLLRRYMKKYSSSSSSSKVVQIKPRKQSEGSESGGVLITTTTDKSHPRPHRWIHLP